MSEKHLKEEEFELFNSDLLERWSKPPIGGLFVRPLRSTDYNKGFIQLLGQLTDVGNIGKEQFLSRFNKMKNAGGYYIVVIEDLNNGRVIACATLVVEQKFIHNCALRGRLEDVVVNKEYRRQKLGKLIVEILVQLARELQCYKMSLECQDHLIPFYEKLGFNKEPNNSNYLNMRFHNENKTEHSHL